MYNIYIIYRKAQFVYIIINIVYIDEKKKKQLYIMYIEKNLY